MDSSSTTNNFLRLPQELRDLIYFYALDGSLVWPTEFKETVDTNRGLSPVPTVFSVDAEAPRLKVEYPKEPPNPTWLSLMRTCRQTKQDIDAYFASNKVHETPTLNLTLSSTTATVTWTSLPSEVREHQDLHIDIRLSHMWDRDNLSVLPCKDNKILRTLHSVLKRYFEKGPHLTREKPLESNLQLGTLILDIAPIPSMEKRFYYGEPWLQMQEVYDVFSRWLERLARSGILWGSVEKIQTQLACSDGRTEKQEVHVTSNVWDESEFTTMKALGYD